MSQDETDDVLTIAAHWYGCILTARPNLTDHNTTDATRLRLMKLLIADAKMMLAVSASMQTPPAQPSEPTPSKPPPFPLPSWCKYKRVDGGGLLCREWGHGAITSIGYTGIDPTWGWWKDTLNYLSNIPPKQATDGVKQPSPAVTTARCQSGRDGDCNWVACPQLRDNEPATTGRHCPLDDGEDRYE